MVKAIIKRTSLTSNESYWQEYSVALDERDNHTVLGLLKFIQSELDSSLGFDYSCRFERCGLCGVIVNGKAGLACCTSCTSQMRIEPLHNLPVVRDLVIDRRFLFPLLKKMQPVSRTAQHEDGFNRILTDWKYYTALAKCNECLCCVSNCPQYDYSCKDFAGPFMFVKLAQLICSDDDIQKLQDTASHFGISECLQCQQCHCPSGIPVFEAALHPFIESSLRDPHAKTTTISLSENNIHP